MGELDGKFFDGVKRLDHTTVEWICGITGRLEIEALDPEGAVPALQMQMSKPHGCWAEGHESSQVLVSAAAEVIWLAGPWPGSSEGGGKRW